jgi:hypothetical protein
LASRSGPFISYVRGEATCHLASRLDGSFDSDRPTSRHGSRSSRLPPKNWWPSHPRRNEAAAQPNPSSSLARSTNLAKGAPCHMGACLFYFASSCRMDCSLHHYKSWQLPRPESSHFSKINVCRTGEFAAESRELSKHAIMLVSRTYTQCSHVTA